jgi:hypothetical protein
MTKILEAEGGAGAAARLAFPTIKLEVTILGDRRWRDAAGWLMKILEAERWLKGTNSHGVVFLQR